MNAKPSAAHAVGHVDADCFYVSAERVRFSFLRDKPVGVLGNQGACVIAKSYEMKAKGVKTGEPIWEARVKCPDGLYVKRDFRWYEVLSRMMLDVVRSLSPRVEYYSIDEFFFEALPIQGSFQKTADAVRERIWRTVRVPATVGIARSKALAKLISDTAKPYGAIAVLDRDDERKYLASRPVDDITGIASRRAARLAPHGIKTCLDFANADRLLIRKLLTRDGEALWYELNGEPVRPILTSRPPHQTLSRGGSLGEATADPDRVNAWLVRNLERLIEELEFHLVQAGRLSVWLGYKEGGHGASEVTLAAPSDRFDLLLDAGQLALSRALLPGFPVNRMHLLATALRYKGSVQLGLFEPPEGRAREVAALKRTVNERFGRFTLRSGATLHLPGVYADPAQGYDICDVRGKMCF